MNKCVYLFVCVCVVDCRLAAGAPARDGGLVGECPTTQSRTSPADANH